MALPHRLALGRSLAVVALCAWPLAGCSSTNDPEPASTTSEQQTIPPTSTATPTASEAPSVTPAPTPTAALTLADRLLPTSAVPGLNSAWHWQDGESGPAGTDPFGICARVDLASIGATEVVQRSYFPPDDSDDNAAQEIASFPDARSTAQAWAVLAAWRSRCSTSDAAGRPAVGPMTPVTVPAGEARWYLVTVTRPQDETGRFEAFGMVRNGTRITVLRMDNSGQDYNYPVGREPMVAMAQAAAGLLR